MDDLMVAAAKKIANRAMKNKHFLNNSPIRNRH